MAQIGMILFAAAIVLGQIGLRIKMTNKTRWILIGIAILLHIPAWCIVVIMAVRLYSRH